jgi:hypothetical protein
MILQNIFCALYLPLLQKFYFISNVEWDVNTVYVRLFLFNYYRFEVLATVILMEAHIFCE